MINLYKELGVSQVSINAYTFIPVGRLSKLIKLCLGKSSRQYQRPPLQHT